MSSGDALTPGKTGGVGSAIFNLHDNGTLDYQVEAIIMKLLFIFIYYFSIIIFLSGFFL